MTREEAIKNLNAHKTEFTCDFGWNTSVIESLDMAIKALEQKPKTGRWIEERTYMECQNCNDIWHYQQNQTHRFKFCPTCGAKMEVEE